jgi:simple sugar transport system permease protein
MFVVLIAPDPQAAFGNMLTGSLTGLGLAETVRRSVPIIALALATAVGLRAGVLNIGCEGQLLLGALAGTIVAVYLPGPALLVVPVAYIAAALAGAAWALLSGLMYTRFALPIFITSLLLNYPARAVVSYLVTFPLKDPVNAAIATVAVPDQFHIPAIASAGSPLDVMITTVFGEQNGILLATRNLDVSAVAVLIAVAGVALVNKRTSIGYETGMLGRNARFAVYGGVDARRTALGSMFLSGAICGLVGAVIVFGSHYRLIDGALVQTNYAWTALLVALLAWRGSVALVATGFTFAAILVAGAVLQRTAGVSAQIAPVMQALIIILVSLRLVLPTSWRRRGQTTTTGDMEATP